MEGDVRGSYDRSSKKYISIHALRVEGDQLLENINLVFIIFQSTPSVWRATDIVSRDMPSGAISIHALRVEGDARPTSRTWLDSYFNPRPPCGGRQDGEIAAVLIGISIHALRVEGDCPTTFPSSVV